MTSEAWNSHQWSDVKHRQIDVEPGKSIIQFHCSRCMRDFVEDTSTGERRAVYVSVFRLRNLPDQISAQWLGEMCPCAPLPFDIEVRSRLIHQHAK